ncbi:hypothetical protein BH23PLA1_BH23PLA1_17510 [soil metagenome]
MPSTLRIPLQMDIEVVVHEIEGGGYWGEVPRFPGCLAQALTIDELRVNILQAIDDWLAEVSEKTEEEARQLAELQGSRALADESYPQAYDYQPPPNWSEEDE